VRRAVAVAVAGGIVLAAATPVYADAAGDDAARSRARRSDRARRNHALVTIGIGAAFMVTEYGVKRQLTGPCRWCDPPGFDRSVRDALVWEDPPDAARAADLTGYLATPVVLLGLVGASSWSIKNPRRWFDDAVPVLQAGFAVGLFDQLFKFTFRRARPLARFGEPGREPELDDNTSFFSGHTSLTFALAVSAGVVAHQRDYALEPLVWASGLTLATATGYLRIAGDKHYLSDVVVGAAMGVGFGLLVPRLFHCDVLGPDLALTPTPTGVAIIGSF
jgi:hypothetical protein